MNEFARIAIEALERENAQLDAADAAIAEALSKRGRRAQAEPSVVYSIRLGREEVIALERRAAMLDMKPSVLARNLVRIGVQGLGHDASNDLVRDRGLAAAVDRLDEVVQELRRLVA